MARGNFGTDLVIGNPGDQPMTEQEAATAAVLKALTDLGGHLVQEDEAILFKGEKFVLPGQYSGRLDKAARDLLRIHEDQKETYSFGRNYNYRPYDGAAAFQRAMKRVFGQAGYGKKTVTFFGSYPPEYMTIETGVGTTDSVPWGRVGLGPIDATFTLGIARDREYGTLFRLEVEAPKMHRKLIAGFFEVVADELRERSIYRGKAINGAEHPGFLDVTGVDPTKVVYSDHTLAQLGANVWSSLEHADAMRAAGMPLKRQVLLEGPYGTGKSLAGALTAQRSVKHGWTFILVRPGQDDLFTALKTAVLYAPAVVQFEDIDAIQVHSGTDLSKLLDMLDSIGNKGSEIVSVFTTNHVDRIPKGVLRPGRIDAVIHIGGLDKSGYRKLVESLIPADQLGDIDYDKVSEAFGYKRVPADTEITNVAGQVVVSKKGELVLEGHGYVLDADGHVYAEGMLPAFVKEAVEKVRRYQLDRAGQFDTVETSDLVESALGLKRQLQLMQEADEGLPAATLEASLTRTVAKAAYEGLINKVKLDQDKDLTLVAATE